MSMAPSLPPLHCGETWASPAPQRFWPFHSGHTQSKTKSSSSGTLLGLSLLHSGLNTALLKHHFLQAHPRTHSTGDHLCVCMLSHFSCVQLFAIPWTVARQAPLSMGVSRQEYWSGLSCPPPEDLPDAGIKPPSLMSPALAGSSVPPVPPGKPGDHLSLSLRWLHPEWTSFLIHIKANL